MLRRPPGEQQPASLQPRTVIGQYIRTMLTSDVARRKLLSTQLGGGKPGWNYDEPAVVQAACEIATKRLWGSTYNVRDITDTVTFMRQASEERRGQAPHGQLEMEAVVRSALGETDIDLSGIIPPHVFEIQLAVTGYAALQLGLNEQEIDQLIVQAEDLAFERGYKPPSAAS